MYRSLVKAEHYELIKQAFDQIGIEEDGFEIRLKGKQSDDFNKGLEELKQRFSGVKIDIK